MTASDLARTLAAAPCVVHFIKADGTARRMLTAPHPEGVTTKGGVVTVFDAEKGAWRSIRAERVVSASPVRARIATRTAAPAARVITPAATERTASDVMREAADDFGGGYVGRRASRPA